MALDETSRATLAALASSLGPGPPDDPEAAARIRQLLQTYEHRYKQEMAAPVKKAGLNMILPKEVVGGEPLIAFGHAPGVKPGDKFKDRGQLYVAGVHATLMKGIHAPSMKNPDFGRGAYSVVMSGGYVDDEDMGESFWYTGEGGIDAASKRQARDQSMERGSNAALRNNCESRTPVRVIRGFVHGGGGGGRGEGGGAEGAGGGDAAAEGSAAGPSGSSGGGGGAGGASAAKAKKEKGFVYEGLYAVLAYKQEASKDGPLVCKFLMHGVPGHSTVNARVEFGIFGGVSASGRLHARRLAAGSEVLPPGSKRARVDKSKKAAEAARNLMLADILARYPGGVLLNEDLSGGQEAVPIPLVNEVNAETLPTDFRYIREYSWHPGVYELVAPVLRFMDEEMDEFTWARQNGTCGLAFNRHIRQLDFQMRDRLPPGYEPHLEEQYNSSGCLVVTDPCGVHECGPACTAAKCRNNKQLSNGVILPLEVFMTESKGWGVRCRETILAGAFVCAYVGQVITDAQAEVRKGQDHYLFDLDFFTHIYNEIREKGVPAIEQEVPLHKIPPVLAMGAVRQIQAHAADIVRERAAAAATAAAATTSAPEAAAAGSGDARAGAYAGTGGPTGGATAAPHPDGAGARGSGADGGGEGEGHPPVDAEGLIAPTDVPAAAAGLLASCSTLLHSTTAGGSGDGGGGGGYQNGGAAAVHVHAAQGAGAQAGVVKEEPGQGLQGGRAAGPGPGPSLGLGTGAVDPATAAAAAAATAATTTSASARRAAALTYAAAAAAAAAPDDPGMFYLTPIFSREEPAAGTAAGHAGGAAVGAGPGPGSRAEARQADGYQQGPVDGPTPHNDDEEYAPVLVLDARDSGNVGRFINHSCDGNLIIQAVFAGNYRNTLVYHVGLFACKDIPPLVELTYNYGYHSQASRTNGQYGMVCHCGAPNCIGQLM